MMEFLDCKICNVPFDEEGHRPRHAPCGHGLCTTCLRAIIKDSIYECPKCRRKNKVNVPDDLPVNFDLIEVIRAFKTKSVPSAKESKARAANGEICNIHCKTISHWCFKCLMWLCGECLDSHSTLLGCTTTISTCAMKTMKEKHIKDIDTLLIEFDEDVKQVSVKMKKHTEKKEELLQLLEIHDKEEKQQHKLYEEGRIKKDNLLESKKQLNKATQPHTVSDYIKLVTQRKQELRSWSAKNNLILETQHDLIKFGRLQKLFHSCSSVVFLEMSLGGALKGRIAVKLLQNLPNLRENLVNIVTGQSGVSLVGEKCDIYSNNYNLRTRNGLFCNIPVTPDTTATSCAKKGDVVGYYGGGYLSIIQFQVGAYSYGSSNDIVVGTIVSGIDILQECYKNYSQGVSITDCGLVLQKV